MIERAKTTRMVMPRAAVEMHSMSANESVYYARCKKCGGIIADDTEPLDVSGLKPEVLSIRIRCRNCKKINFVSHK